MCKLPEVFIVAINFSSYNSVKGMMKLVDPLSIKSIAALFRELIYRGLFRSNSAIENFFLPKLFFQSSYLSCEFLNKMCGTEIPNGMYSIKAQSVNMKFVQPHEGILPVEMTYTIAPRIIKIYRLSPPRFVFIGKIWPIFKK